MKSKMMILILGFSIALTGCGSTGNNQTSDRNTQNNTQSIKQTSNSWSANTNSGTNQASQAAIDKTVEANQSTAAATNNSSDSSTKPAPRGDINMSMVTAVRMADFNTGWVGGNGWVAKTVDAGKSWAVVYQGTGTVQQIFALNHTDVWVTLNHGGTPELLNSNDGGQNWSYIGAAPDNAFLHFISTTTAFSGNYFSEDGGKTWHEQSIPNNTVGDAYFHDEKNGWAVTQSSNAFSVNRTTDGGKSWEIVMTKKLVSSRLNGTVIRSAGTNDAWIELIGDTGMSQTSYSVFHTTDGGKSWTNVIANSTAGGGPAPGFSQDDHKGSINNGTKPGPLYVVSPQVAFMGGICPACDHQNSVGWTKDEGNTWTNSNVTLAGNGDDLLAFADETDGWWITTENGNASTMYTTTDGGHHWHQAFNFH